MEGHLSLLPNGRVGHVYICECRDRKACTNRVEEALTAMPNEELIRLSKKKKVKATKRRYEGCKKKKK